jgi:hypothetical protein
VPDGDARLAETQRVSEVDAVNRERRVTIAARVPPDLAEALAALAEACDRTVSREVFRAIRAHVQKSTVGFGSSVDDHAERRLARDQVPLPKRPLPCHGE